MRQPFATAALGGCVARICADLGVTPDRSLWDDQDWAIEYEKSLPPNGDIGAERWWHLEPPTDGAASAQDRGGTAPDSS